MRENDPVIAGWAHTVFGKAEAESVTDLIAQVARPAIAHAGLEPRDIDAVFVGTFGGGFTPQGFEGALPGMAVPELAETPSQRLENACATGSAALYAAADFIAAGRGRTALVIGAEKMTALPVPDAGRLMLTASWVDEEADTPAGFAGIFGRVADHYFQRYGDRSEDLARIAAKNHAHAVANPYAHMKKDLGLAFCNTPSERNPRVAGPLRRTDCSLISDGAAAIVLAAPDLLADLPRAVRFRGRAQGADVLALSRRDPIAFAGARRAWEGAHEAAGTTVDDLDVVETHDCFTIAELIEYEAMGLAAPGEGHVPLREGVTTMGGRLPVNPSGGLKARGHPLGATGVSQHVMAALQVMGEAGEMQVPGVELAGVFNMGGIAVANYASILERAK